MAELRRHPILGEWVVVCPERGDYLAERCQSPCLYCPGNEHRRGVEVYSTATPSGDSDPRGRIKVVAGSPPLFKVEGGLGKRAVGMCDCMESIGAHEVVIESPAHGDGLDTIDQDRLRALLEVIRLRMADLARDKRFSNITVFRLEACDDSGNRAHPVWDIVATPFIPRAIKDELRGAKQYFLHKERCAFCDYIRQEAAAKERVIFQDPHTIAISPYAARFPFEIWLMPFRHSPDFGAAGSDEIVSVARSLKMLVGALKRLEHYRGHMVFIHTAPVRREKAGDWETLDQDYHWHIEVVPRLNGVDGMRESVGFHLNPMPSEEAAGILRSALPQ
jgi:UDPglucose--hexose-1-phosphate uridylyltransferase